MDAPVPSQAAIRARAFARHDAFLECVEGDRSSNDVLGLLRGRVRDTRTSPPPRDRTSIRFWLPAVRPGRVVIDGKRPMHMQFTKSPNRTAAEVDRYATEARDGRAADAEAELGTAGGDFGSAAALDAYATRDRIDVGDRPHEQVTSNIPGTSVQRGAVWHQIELFEEKLHKPGKDRINFKRDEAAGFLTHIQNHPACPADLRDFIKCTGRHAKAGKKLNKRRALIGSSYIASTAAKDHKWLLDEYTAFAPNHVGPPPFKLSRARQVQAERHGDFELPAELDEAAHQRVAQKLLVRIEAHATPDEREVGLSQGSVVEKRLPVVIAHHPPEAANNKLNWHFHFLFHDRAVAIDDDGTVHFAAKKAAALTRLGMMKRVRRDVAEIINEELAAANTTVRVTTESFADLGSDATPQLKLGKGLVRLEEAGEVTENGLHNRVESWTRPRRADLKYVADRQRDIAAGDGWLRRRIAGATRISSAERQQLDDERCKILGLQKVAIEAEATARYADFIIAMAESDLKDRGEKASRRRDMASMPREQARWAAEVDDAQTSQLHLLDELGPERATRDHAHATAAAAIAEGETRRAALINMFDRASSQASARGMTSRNDELHRFVAIIHSTPLVVSQTKGVWGVAAADDTGRILARADLSAPDIQLRLGRIADQQTKERAVVVAWLSKHGPATTHQDALAGTTDYVRDLVARWQHSEVVRQLVEQRHLATSAPAAAKTHSHFDYIDFEVPVEGITQINAMISGFRGTSDRHIQEKRAAVARRPPEVHDMPALHRSMNDAIRGVAAAVGAGNPTRDLPLVQHVIDAHLPPSPIKPAGIDEIQPAIDARPESSPTGAASSDPCAGSVGPATPRHFVDPAAAAVARLFHDTDWSPADYWASPARGLARVPEQATHRARSTTASLPSSPIAEPKQRPAQLVNANQARAAFAQSQRVDVFTEHQE